MISLLVRHLIPFPPCLAEVAILRWHPLVVLLGLQVLVQVLVQVQVLVVLLGLLVLVITPGLEELECSIRVPRAVAEVGHLADRVPRAVAEVGVLLDRVPRAVTEV